MLYSVWKGKKGKKELDLVFTGHASKYNVVNILVDT